jgi:ParB family chromosome partitioning protein
MRRRSIVHHARVRLLDGQREAVVEPELPRDLPDLLRRRLDDEPALVAALRDPRIGRRIDRDLVRLEEQLADLLAAAVEIRVHRKTKRGEQGEIAISFDSLEELNGLLDKLGLRER